MNSSKPISVIKIKEESPDLTQNTIAPKDTFIQSNSLVDAKCRIQNFQQKYTSKNTDLVSKPQKPVVKYIESVVNSSDSLQNALARNLKAVEDKFLLKNSQQTEQNIHCSKSTGKTLAQNVQHMQERQPDESDDDYRMRFLKMVHESVESPSSIKVPMHEAFELSIEEIDTASVDAQTLFNTTRQKHIYESPEARGRRLARNAERMRERRSNETDEEYRIRLLKTAEANRLRRLNENEIERTMRHVKDAARQRLRRAMETTEQRSIRLAKLAERTKKIRENETPEQRMERLRKSAERHKERFARTSTDEKEFNEEKCHNGSTSYLSILDTNSAALKPPSNNAFPTGSVNNGTDNIHDFVQSPSGSSSISSSSEPSLSQQFSQYDNPYSPYQLFRTNHFPDLPPHLAPNQPKYYGNIQNYMVSNNSSLQYLPSNTAVRQTAPLSQPYRPMQLQPSTQNHSQMQYNTDMAMPIRGRPKKIFPSNDYRSIGPAFKEEAERQQRLNDMLEEQINYMLSTPKQSRGRPSKGKETDVEREERLKKMAEARRIQRDKETMNERQVRLKDLAERARKRRETTLANETAEKRKERLFKQAEYARQRRLKTQTPESLRMAEQKAKTLYAKLHKESGEPIM